MTGVASMSRTGGVAAPVLEISEASGLREIMCKMLVIVIIHPHTPTPHTPTHLGTIWGSATAVTGLFDKVNNAEMASDSATSVASRVKIEVDGLELRSGDNCVDI